MKFTSDRPIKIFRFEDNGKVRYTYSVGKKRKDSQEYDNAFFPIQFKQGVDIPDKSLINIINAFPSFYSWEFQGKKGNTYFIMCTDFEIVKDEEPKEIDKQSNDPFAEFGDMVSTENDDFLD